MLIRGLCRLRRVLVAIDFDECEPEKDVFTWHRFGLDATDIYSVFRGQRAVQTRAGCDCYLPCFQRSESSADLGWMRLISALFPDVGEQCRFGLDSTANCPPFRGRGRGCDMC